MSQQLFSVELDTVIDDIKTFEKYVNKYNVKYKITNENGPAGGHPIVKFVGTMIELGEYLTNVYDSDNTSEFTFVPLSVDKNTAIEYATLVRTLYDNYEQLENIMENTYSDPSSDFLHEEFSNVNNGIQSAQHNLTQIMKMLDIDGYIDF